MTLYQASHSEACTTMRKQADHVPPMATLRLAAENLIPEDVGRILACKATLAAKKGENLLRRKDGEYAAARTGTWFLTTEGEPLGLDPAAHLSWIVQILSRNLLELRQRIPLVQVDFSLLVHDGNFRIHDLPNTLIRQTVALGDLEIDIPSNRLDVVLTSENVDSYILN